ncbi:hypothetical protein [Nostoc sp.]|uniref:hypothetical protein n=1 Tax=Nostoc sp. TaxID=1180 RepID=UPI002FF61548
MTNSAKAANNKAKKSKIAVRLDLDSIKTSFPITYFADEKQVKLVIKGWESI